MTLGFALEVAK